MKFKSKEDFFLFVTTKIEELKLYNFPDPDINNCNVIINYLNIVFLDSWKEYLAIKIAHHESKYYIWYSITYALWGSGCSPSISPHRWPYNSISEFMKWWIEIISLLEKDWYSSELLSLIEYSKQYLKNWNTLQTLF